MDIRMIGAWRDFVRDWNHPVPTRRNALRSIWIAIGFHASMTIVFVALLIQSLMATT